MAGHSKSQIVAEVLDLLRTHYRASLDPPAKLPVLESVIFGICHNGCTREQAVQAVNRFKDQFYDWNEVRVSRAEEIAKTLADLPNPEPRAQQIRQFLRQLFRHFFTFDLDHMTKWPLKESAKELQKLETMADDYVFATVVQLALGGHAIPVDEPLRCCLIQLALIEPDVEVAAARSAIERAVPKSRGLEFSQLMERLTHDLTPADDARSPWRDLRAICGEPMASKPRGRSTKSETNVDESDSEEGPGKKTHTGPNPDRTRNANTTKDSQSES